VSFNFFNVRLVGLVGHESPVQVPLLLSSHQLRSIRPKLLYQEYMLFGTVIIWE